MKRLISLTIFLLLVLGLTGCGGQQNENDDEIKIIPKPQKQELSVVSIDELHAGIAQDISPDGKTLLLSWDQGLPDKDPNDEMSAAKLLHTLNLADGKVTKISDSEIHQGNAKYSPDGKKIAFLENVETFFEAYVMENKLNATKKQIHKSDEIANSQITWSPDGKIFAVSYFLINDGRIALYDAQGNETRSIEQKNGIAIFPKFLDNDTLLYVSVDHVNGLKVMSLDVSEKNAAAQVVVRGTNFDTSPSKQKLAYLVSNEDRSQWKIKIDAIDANLKVGSTLAETEVQENGAQMTWSPDSRYLLYSDKGDIWTLDTETGEKKQLVSGMSQISNMLWQQDETVIFTAVPKEAEQQNGYSFITYKITLE